MATNGSHPAESSDVAALEARIAQLEARAPVPGPQGPQGIQGVQGIQGLAGPAYIAYGVVNPSGTFFTKSGIVPTVTRTSAGHYTLTITGMGTGLYPQNCPAPQVQGVNVQVTVTQFACYGSGEGRSSITLVTEDGLDHAWTYLYVGADAGAASSSSSSSKDATGSLTLP